MSVYLLTPVSSSPYPDPLPKTLSLKLSFPGRFLITPLLPKSWPESQSEHFHKRRNMEKKKKKNAERVALVV